MAIRYALIISSLVTGIVLLSQIFYNFLDRIFIIFIFIIPLLITFISMILIRKINMISNKER
ncbi:MAG: hypothetical protein ACP5IZ_06970 [Thermoprotei archaeon]|jgi:hypothetical protein